MRILWWDICLRGSESGVVSRETVPFRFSRRAVDLTEMVYLLLYLTVIIPIS